MQAKRQDVYIANPALLNGKPKETIGNYIREKLEKNPFPGFRLMVPDIYKTFGMAKKNDGFGRSEIKHEYAGPSGLLHSVPVWHYGSEEELMKAIFLGPAIKEAYFENYCRYKHLGKEKFRKEVSVSYWQYIYGKNHTVVADSAVEGRYHIFTGKKNDSHYVCIDNGKVIHSFGSIDLGLAKRLIDAYEYVRNLGNFDPQHCPIMELQTTDDGTVWFLQYHRARDFKKAAFTLERKPDKDEVVASWVRGATGTEKQEFGVRLFYGNYKRMWNTLCPMNEGWMHDGRNLPTYYESMMAGRRGLQLIPTDMSFVCTHQEISCLIKPEISALIAGSRLVSPEEYKRKWGQAWETKTDQFIIVQVSSDGRKLYAKRVG
jgi:hypothetical protein